MTQKGTHTWDLILHYHRCPKCGYIIESRNAYQNILGVVKKELTCDRCHNHFIVTKKINPTLGPLFGDPQPVEIEWREIKRHDRI